MVAFANPVPQAVIRPPGSPPIIGDFRVICDFACHMARTPPKQGIDISDGTCGKPVLAMAPGKVSFIKYGVIGSTLSADASIVLVDFGNGYKQGAGHLKIRSGLAVGQQVPEGYQLGTIDKIGANACHLHGGMKQLINGVWVEIDWWPLLRQNGATEETDMTPIPPGKFVQLDDKKTSVSNNGKGANFRAERVLPPDPRATVLEVYPDGTAFVPLMQADDGSPAGGATPTRWYAGFGVNKAGFAIFGWFHSSVLATLQDDLPAGGHTDAELMAAAALARANGISDAGNAALAVK
jgi:murein DD-endopeptidase MepM/ murein hydrolase activator NlpD